MNEPKKIFYVGVDDWNRPTFRSVENRREFYCDVFNLFDYYTPEDKIIEFYGTEPVELNYKGWCFDSEPMGDPTQVVIVFRDTLNL